jgi:hypothetical protein
MARPVPTDHIPRSGLATEDEGIDGVVEQVRTRRKKRIYVVEDISHIIAAIVFTEKQTGQI